MSFSVANRALLRAMLAGAVVLTGTACSRSDRAKSGPDNTAAAVPDTSSNAAQPSNSGTMTGAVSDTTTPSDQPSSSAQPTPSAPSNAPRAETAPSDTDAAGYRSMERDPANTPNEHSDSARVTADTSVSQTSDSATAEMSAGNADTAAAGYAEMARDTGTVADQADTAAANGDVALRATVDTSSEASADVSAETGVAAAGAADTTGNAGRQDSTEILGQVTTDSTSEAVSPDSIELVRVRPPEDSTEILGNATTYETADETADEQVVRPEDRETVAASETPTDEVGASAMGGNVTGVEAVALMTREGLRCAIVDPETNEAARWDMSSTPVALNPCGMGSMILSRIWTEGSAGQE